MITTFSEIFERNTTQRHEFHCAGPHRGAIADALVDALNRQFPIEKIHAYRWQPGDTESTICVMLPTWQLRHVSRAELEAAMRRRLMRRQAA